MRLNIRKLMHLQSARGRNCSSAKPKSWPPAGHVHLNSKTLTSILSFTGIFPSYSQSKTTAKVLVRRRELHVRLLDEFAVELEQLLGREDIARLRLPDEIANQPPEKALLSLRQRLADIPQELGQLENELATLAAQWQPRLHTYRACLQDRLAELAVLDQLGETA